MSAIALEIPVTLSEVHVVRYMEMVGSLDVARLLTRIFCGETVNIPSEVNLTIQKCILELEQYTVRSITGTAYSNNSLYIKALIWDTNI